MESTLLVPTTIYQPVDVVVGEDFDFAFFVGDFGGFETDISDGAFEAVGLGDDSVTDTELIFGDNRDASDKIFYHILEGEANNGS